MSSASEMFASISAFAFLSILERRLLTRHRRLFERGADSVGLDFLAHPFWDKYLEFEERVESHDRLFAVLARIIPIPMHQYARYFERYRTMAAGRPLTEIAPQEVRVRFEQEMSQSGSSGQTVKDLEQQMRSRIDGWHLEIFNHTQEETTKRWTYESEIKRPYYHLTELDEPQLLNWMKYLDFEEEEGDYARIKFLYERCLVTTANYEDFWLRYARWMFAQPNKQEEVRSILARASCTYVPIVKTEIRLFYAQFEEAAGRPEVAAAIHEAILDKMPNHIDAIISLANLERRQHGVESAIFVLQKYKTDNIAGAMTSEWARLVCNVNGDVAGARTIYESNEHHHVDSINFYSSWLNFELRQAPVELGSPYRNQRVKAVFDAIRKSSLTADEVKDLAILYFQYLKSSAGADAMQEYLQLDAEINGSISVAKNMKEKAREQARQKAAEQGQKLKGQNGQPIGVVDEDGADHPYFQPH